MKEQISNMNNEMLHFRRTNGGLKLFVSDLRLCLIGMQQESRKQQIKITQNKEYKLGYQLDIYKCYTAIDDY